MTRKQKSFFVFFIVGVFFSSPSWAQYDPKAKTILESAKARYSAIDYYRIKFTSSLENKAYNTKESYYGSIIVQENRYHLILKNQEIINDGTTVWTYLKDAKEVNISNYEPDEDDITPNKVYSLYEKGFKYAIEQENVAIEGGTYDKIRLSPTDTKVSYHTIFLFIKKNAGVNTGAIKKWQIYEKNGNEITYSVYEFTKYPKVVTENPNYFYFDTKKYPGVEVVDLR